MQIGNEQIERQQLIMRLKGFYHGKLDGIWGPKTIAAKQKWEMDPSYTPAIPNNGLPMGNRGPYPRGVIREETGMLTCPEVIDHLSKQQQKKKEEPQVVAKVEAAKDEK